MLELEHIPLYKGFLYLLTGPCDEQLVIMVSLYKYRETRMSRKPWRLVAYILVSLSKLLFKSPQNIRWMPSILVWCTYKHKIYCGWLNFHGVPIFVVFIEGPVQEFRYPRISNFQYELWRKILCPRILNPTNVLFSFNPWKLVPTKTKPSTV